MLTGVTESLEKVGGLVLGRGIIICLERNSGKKGVIKYNKNFYN